MKSTPFQLLCLFLIVGLFSCSGPSSSSTTESSSENKQETAIEVFEPESKGAARNFKASLRDGSPFELKELRGNYVLLDFWGSWCRPCRAANPKLVKLHDSFKDEVSPAGEKFHIVSVGIEAGPKRWEEAIKADKLNWKHHIMESRGGTGPRIVDSYGVRGIPTHFLIDPNGKIVGRNLSDKEIRDILNEKLKS